MALSGPYRHTDRVVSAPELLSALHEAGTPVEHPMDPRAESFHEERLREAVGACQIALASTVVLTGFAFAGLVWSDWSPLLAVALAVGLGVVLVSGARTLATTVFTLGRRASAIGYAAQFMRTHHDRPGGRTP